MIETVEELRKSYPEPKKRALLKQLDRLDRHCRRFIGLAPLLVLATTGKDGRVRTIAIRLGSWSRFASRKRTCIAPRR